MREKNSAVNQLPFLKGLAVVALATMCITQSARAEDDTMEKVQNFLGEVGYRIHKTYEFFQPQIDFTRRIFSELVEHIEGPDPRRQPSEELQSIPPYERKAPPEEPVDERKDRIDHR